LSLPKPVDILKEECLSGYTKKAKTVNEVYIGLLILPFL
jgi:hypothetical protein